MRRKCRKAGHAIRADMAGRIAAIRDECQRAAEMLSSADELSEAKLAECARLSDSLDATQRFLKSAVAHLAIERRKKSGQERV